MMCRLYGKRSRSGVRRSRVRLDGGTLLPARGSFLLLLLLTLPPLLAHAVFGVRSILRIATVAILVAVGHGHVEPIQHDPNNGSSYLLQRFKDVGEFSLSGLLSAHRNDYTVTLSCEL